MEQKSILALSTVQAVAGKVIRDLKNGGKRETRNVIELCKSLAKRPQQQNFWDMVKEFTNLSGGQYDALLHRTAASVREDSLKTLAVNLGCTAFSSIGSKKATDSWLCSISYSTGMEADVNEWNDRGVFVFLIELNSDVSPDVICSLASRHTRSIFILLVREKSPNHFVLSKAAAFDNICFLLEPRSLSEAEPLRRKQSLYGVLRDYSQAENALSEKQALESWIEQGCVVAVYETRAPWLDTDTDFMYRDLVRARSRGAVEIFLCDLQRDPKILLEIIKKQRPLPARIVPESKSDRSRMTKQPHCHNSGQ